MKDMLFKTSSWKNAIEEENLRLILKAVNGTHLTKNKLTKLLGNFMNISFDQTEWYQPLDI